MNGVTGTNSEERLTNALHDFLQTAIAIAEADFGTLQLLKPETGQLEIITQIGFPSWWMDDWKTAATGQGTCGIALEQGKRVLVDDVEHSPVFAGTPVREIHLRAGVRAMQSTPILSRSGVLLGGFSTHYKKQRRLSEQILKNLDLLSRQAADLLEQFQSVQLQRAANQELRQFVLHAPAAIAMLDRDMRYLLASSRWLSDYGLRSDELSGRSIYEVLPEVAERWKDIHQRALAGDVVRSEEELIVRPDGTRQWLRREVRPWYAHGQVAGVLILSEDITERKASEQSIREGREQLNAILQTAYDAIITINQQGMIQLINPATERMFGYTSAELVGQNVSLLMPSPYREEHDGYLLRYLETGQAHIIGIGREVQAQRKDGSILAVELAISQVDHLGMFTGMIRDITRRKQLEREIVEIASLEQRRIGSDLHDSVGQELTALNMLSTDLKESLQDPVLGPKVVDQLSEGLLRCQQDLRVVMRGLLPVPVDREGLMAALVDLVNRTETEGEVHCTFDCPVPIAIADNLVATHLYYIAQEAVHNAVKHARAKSIHITLNAVDYNVLLRVQDDGIGMPTRPSEHRGLGLRIMRNRAEIIGAKLTIEPVVPHGTLVNCFWLRTNHASAPLAETKPRADR